MKVIKTKNAPEAIGPYSQAIVKDKLVFTSGQIPINPKTGAVDGSTIDTQSRQVMENLKALLQASGSSMENAVKTTCFLADMSDFASFNKIYSEYFTVNPARSCIAVKQLPKNVLVEVEVIAELK